MCGQQNREALPLKPWAVHSTQPFREGYPVDALPQPHVNQSWSLLPWDVWQVCGEGWVLQPRSVSSILVVLSVLLPTGFGHWEVQLWLAWRMGPSGNIIPHAYLHLGSSHVLPSLFHSDTSICPQAVSLSFTFY